MQKKLKFSSYLFCEIFFQYNTKLKTVFTPIQISKVFEFFLGIYKYRDDIMRILNGKCFLGYKDVLVSDLKSLVSETIPLVRTSF